MVLQDNNFTVVKVARNEDLTEQIGRDIVFDLVNHDKLRCFCINNQIPFCTFKEAAAKEFGIPVQFQRFWLWAMRANLTYRPHRPLTHEEETQTIGQLREILQKSQNAELKLFLEVEHGPDSYLIHPPEICKEDILIFFKLYDPAIEKLRYVGRLLVKSTGRPSGILMKLNEMAGFFSSQEIDLYEEIKFEPSVLCEPIEKELTFQASQLENGDIVCFQKSPTVGSGQQYRYPDVPSYLEYVHDRQVVNFRPLEKPNDEGFCVELSKISNYDEVVKKVACQLGVIHPSKIRLTYHNCYTHKPEPTPIKYRGSKHLSDMLLYCNQLSDILYYEVLEDNHFTIIKVARNEDLAQQIGRDICFDLVNHDKVQCFRVMKETPFYAFKEEVAKEFGIPVIFQRFWLWAKRKNLTYRPHRPVTHEEERQPIGQLREISQKSQNAELKLFLEVEHGPDFYLIQPPEICKEDILIFFKLYDPAIEELRYVGRLLVKSTGRPSGILMKLNELAGFLSSQEIDLYEEIKFEPSVMCVPIEKELTFQASQLENGDIVCFQKSPTVGSGQQYRYPDVPSYLEYVHNRLIVHFRPREEPTQAQFSLELSKVYTYEETVTRVAFKLGVYDQSRIRLTPHDSSSNHPKPTPIKYDDKKQLSDILIDDNQMATDILYYEVMEISASKPSLCVVCFDVPLEGACLPCGHMSACMSCLNEINRRNMGCPVCRADIHQVVRIYV